VDPKQNTQTVELKYVDGWLGFDSHFPTFTLNFGQIIDRPEVEKLTAQGAVLIDVREGVNPEENLLPKEVRIPYKRKPKRKASFYQAYSHFAFEDTFDVTRLPQDKNRPLIFFAGDCASVGPFRAMVFARMHGWKNLYWYRNGSYGWNGIFRKMPSSFPGLKEASYSDLVALQKQGGKVYDVLHIFSPDQNEKPERIPGAIFVPYAFKGKYKDLVNYRSRPSEADLKTLQKDFPMNLLPQDHSTPVIFIGEDAYDWAPVHIGYGVQALGWKNVYFYRGGRLNLRYSYMLENGRKRKAQ
jgi:rhodanese-related sulfurtransferase